MEKKVIGLMKDELGGKIMKESSALREKKTYIYSTDNNDKDRKAKGTKKCVIKRKFKFEDYKNCLKATELENKIDQLEKNKVNIDNLKKIIKYL